MKIPRFVSALMVTIAVASMLIVVAMGGKYLITTSSAEQATKTDAERYYAKPLCLGGVAYWQLGIGNARRIALKYTPGSSTPDTCDE